MFQKMKKALKRAFTITELVVVIAVIAILAAVLIPTFTNVIRNANQSAALQTCTNALHDYQAIAAEENETEDTTGIVFVSNGYAYVYLNSSLQFVGKTEDMAVLKSDGTFTGELPVSGANGFKWKSAAPSAAVTEITLKYQSNNAEVDITKTELAVEVLEDDDSETETTAKKAENVYFYVIENVNGSSYIGWFTLEQADNNGLCKYSTQGANYARRYGYSVVSDTTNITVSYTTA